MDDRDAQIVVDHLHRIEKRLEEMDRRLRLLEVHAPATPQVHPRETWASRPESPSSPPVVDPSLSPEPPPPLAQQLRPAWDVAAQTAKPSGVLTPPPLEPKATAVTKETSGDDLEYKIGRIGLLWAGAVVVVIGILYLVALAVARNSVSPQVRFGGELALCTAFIVIGFFKRNEREDFGQLLTGIGSCGLYLAFAGGQVYKGLYSSETAVGLFAILSLANLGYAAWRSSRSFLALGMIGGMVSAMLPMHSYNAPLDVGLHFFILIPCALIVAKNKWLDMASWLWLASTLALLPVYTYVNHVWLLRVGALYADALVCAAAYAFVYRKWVHDPKCALPFAFIVIAGIGGVAIEGVKNGSLHVFALAAGAVAIGWLLRDRSLARNSLYAGALTVAVTLAPMGYTRTEAAVAFALLSIGLSLASTRIASVTMRSLAYVELALATLAYLGAWMPSPPGLPFASEITVLVAMMAAVITGAVWATRSGLSAEGAIGVGAAAMLPLFERFGDLFLTSPSVHVAPFASAFYTTLTAYAVIYAIARWRQFVVPVVISWFLYFGILSIYLVSVSAPGYRFDVDLSMVGCLLIAALRQGALTAPRYKDAEEFAIGASGTMVGFYVVRLSYLLLTHYWNFAASASIVAGACVWTLLAVAVQLRLKLKPLVPVAWIGMFVLLMTLWPMGLWTERGLRPEAALDFIGVGCILAVGAISIRATAAEWRQQVLGFFGLIVGGTWMRFVYLELATTKAHFANTHAVAAGAVTCLIASAIIFWRYREKAMVPLGWVWTATLWSAAVPPQDVLGLDHGGLRYTTPMLLLALAAPLLVARMTATLTKDRLVLTAISVVLEWAAFTRLCVHAAHHTTIRSDAVVSMAWTAFAAILICLGFGYKAPYLRYWALAVFATVVGKVFMLDLANVDSTVRVAILLFLGVCMVGGGYGYVRWRQVKPIDKLAG